MCLINIAFRHHPSYPLILVGNRDEFYARPTASLHWWEDTGETVLGGRDLKDGGTWMGMSKDGRFAALTNYRDPAHMRTDTPSRGKLVKDFLTGKMPMDEMQRYLMTQGRRFNGFNLLYGTSLEMFYFNNVQEQHRQLYPGIYGLSNAFLDTPWPKVRRSKSRFEQQLDIAVDESSFLSLLSNPETAPDDELPDTGVPREWEKLLSAMFITSAEYGTRLTTFVSVDSTGRVVYREKGYIPASDTRITFTLEQ